MTRIMTDDTWEASGKIAEWFFPNTHSRTALWLSTRSQSWQDSKVLDGSDDDIVFVHKWTIMSADAEALSLF